MRPLPITLGLAALLLAGVAALSPTPAAQAQTPLPSAANIISQTRAQVCASFVAVQPTWLRDRLLAQAGCALPTCAPGTSCDLVQSPPTFCQGFTPGSCIVVSATRTVGHHPSDHTATIDLTCPANYDFTQATYTRSSDWLSVAYTPLWLIHNTVHFRAINFDVRHDHSFTAYLECVGGA